jgi:hypothetical protein
MEWKLALFLAAPIAVTYVVNLALCAVRTNLQKPVQELPKHDVQTAR